MLIRHIGFCVRNINKIGSILQQLGFSLVYSEYETIGYIEKWMTYNNIVVELYLQRFYGTHKPHICFEGEVPGFMEKEYNIIKMVPYDPSYEVYVVDVDDNIFFEFARKIK